MFGRGNIKTVVVLVIIGENSFETVAVWIDFLRVPGHLLSANDSGVWGEAMSFAMLKVA